MQNPVDPILDPGTLLHTDTPDLRGTLLEFLDYLQGDPQAPAQILETSTTQAEIQAHAQQLSYRRAWLSALLAETERELAVVERILGQQVPPA